MLGLSKSQKNCHEEICSCSKASCSVHLLAMGIVSPLASSGNAALFYSHLFRTVSEKEVLLAFRLSDKKSQVQSNHRSRKVPQTWVLAALLHESTSSSLEALYGNDALIQENLWRNHHDCLYTRK